MNNLIWHVIEADAVLSPVAPFMYEVDFTDSGVLIKDEKIDRFVEVRVVQDKLFCELDQRDDCIHVGFAYAIPRVYRVMNALGKRPKATSPNPSPINTETAQT